MKKTLPFVLLAILLITIINVSATETQNLEMSLLSYTPSPVQPGQVIDLELQLIRKDIPLGANDLGSTETNEDAWVQLLEEYPFNLRQTEDLARSMRLGKVAFTQTLFFRIKVDDDAKDGIYPLTVRYGIGDEKDTYSEETFDINVETFDATLTLVKIKQEPKEIIPGEMGKLTLVLVNNDDKPLSNIDILLDLTGTNDMNAMMNNMVAVQAMINSRLEDINRRVASGMSPLTGPTPMMKESEMGEPVKAEFGGFAPVDTSNLQRLGVLKAHDQTEIVFNIQALPDADPGVYAVPLYIGYNDENNKPFHLKVDIPLTINMEPELHVEMKSTSLRSTDFSGEVVFSVANRGLSELRYVVLELEEDETYTLLTAPQTIYIGDLKPGESKEGTFNIIADEEDVIFPLKVEHRDSFNREWKNSFNLPLHIINKNYYRDLPYEMWLAWLILGGVVLVLTMFYVRNISKKNE